MYWTPVVTEIRQMRCDLILPNAKVVSWVVSVFSLVWVVGVVQAGFLGHAACFACRGALPGWVIRWFVRKMSLE